MQNEPDDPIVGPPPHLALERVPIRWISEEDRASLPPLREAAGAGGISPTSLSSSSPPPPPTRRSALLLSLDFQSPDEATRVWLTKWRQRHFDLI